MTDIAQRPVSRLLDLSGRRAVVTGAAAGIGLAIASRLAEAGAVVLMSDLNPTSLEGATRQLSEKGYRVESAVADIGREADIVSLFKAAADKLGGVEILVNNAGIYPQAKILKMTTDQWRDVMRINLDGVFLCSREAGRQMVRQGRGVIVNITSMGAFKPCYVGLAHYESSKGAILNLTRSTALELAPYGIRAVAVAPGGIWTEGTPAAREGEKNRYEAACAKIPCGDFGQPDDIARAVLFLASDAAAYITGTTLMVDGGMLLA